MNKSIVLVLTIAFFSVDSLLAQNPPKQLKISRIFMENCEMGTGPCDPVEIIRSDKNQSLEILIPSGGSQSDVFLFDQEGIDLFWVGKMKEATPIQHDRCGSARQPKIILDGVPDGVYFIRLLSCNLGGGFQLNLKTLAN